MSAEPLLQPLPARTCSRCVNWLARIYGTEEREGVLKAVCEIHVKQTSGGETCGQWRREPEVTHVVEIRRNIDGVIRLHLEHHEWLDSYMWEDGNYACDCNRYLFFMRAADEDEGDDYMCGDELFSVRITDSNGHVLYQDGAFDHA